MKDNNEEFELDEKYKDRLKTPKEDWVEYEGPEQLMKLVMEDKQKNGWKFKDEK